MRISRVPAAALALSAIAAGVVLAVPSQAATKPCVSYPDPAGDTVAEIEDPVNIPAADGDTDLTGVAIATTADSLVGYVKVAALGTRSTYAPGDWHEFGFTVGEKVVRVFVERLPAPLDGVIGGEFGYGGVYVGETYTQDIATAKYDTASNTVAVSVKLADLDKALGAPTKKAKLTKITGRTRMHYGLLFVTMDHLAAPEAASYVVGTACAPPVATAPAPAPSGSASAAPSASASASAAPSASASAAPSASASASAAPSASPKPSPKPSPSAAPKKNPGCGTAGTASPKPSASGSVDPSASASASVDPSASAAPSASASASAGAVGAHAVPTSSTNGQATNVSLRVNTTEITACNAPQLSGQVTDVQGRGMAGVEVKLAAKAHNSAAYATFATVVTDSVGQYRISVRPTVHTSYVASAGEVKSATVPVRVHTRVVVESPRKDTAVRNPVTLRGRLVPGHVKAAVELGYTRNGRYVVLGRSSTDGQGYWVVSGRPATGRQTLVVSTPQRDGNLAGQGSVTITVQ